MLLLARWFIAEAACRYQIPPRALHPDTLAWLQDQAWPGNIRELRNRIQREFLMGDGPVIHISGGAPVRDSRHQVDLDQAPPDTLNFNEAKQRAMRDFERGHLIRLMRHSLGNVSQAARLAGKERRTLGKLLKKHHIEPGQFRPD